MSGEREEMEAELGALSHNEIVAASIAALERAERAEADLDNAIKNGTEGFAERDARVRELEQGIEIHDDLIVQLRARIAELEGAITNASYCLDPNQGERPDPSRAGQWLRTTFPKDHPNYVDPATLPPGFAALSPTDTPSREVDLRTQDLPSDNPTTRTSQVQKEELDEEPGT